MCLYNTHILKRTFQEISDLEAEVIAKDGKCLPCAQEPRSLLSSPGSQWIPTSGILHPDLRILTLRYKVS